MRSKAPGRPKLGPLVPVIDAVLEVDKTALPKQRHTAKRIFERLRIEHGYAFGYTVVKDSCGSPAPIARGLHPARPSARPRAGRGVRMKLHVFCFDLPQSDACFIKANPAETTEASSYFPSKSLRLATGSFSQSVPRGAVNSFCKADSALSKFFPQIFF